MKTALVGHTGFVGSNLKKQYDFDDFYNSKNIDDIQYKTYDLIVFAGVPAVKWMANKEPENDLKIIEALQNILKTITAKQFILISTIDVYPLTKDYDENFECNSLENHAYGKHRLLFENFCQTQFKNCVVMRLPGLFGDGIKKNVIYDLMNDNCLEMINVDSSFQYYFLDHLWVDIQKAIEKNIKLLNLFTEPISTKTIVNKFFQEKLNHIGSNKVPEMHYNLYTKYAKFWGKDKYLYDKDEVLVDLGRFIERYKGHK